MKLTAEQLINAGFGDQLRAQGVAMDGAQKPRRRRSAKPAAAKQPKPTQAHLRKYADRLGEYCWSYIRTARGERTMRIATAILILTVTVGAGCRTNGPVIHVEDSEQITIEIRGNRTRGMQGKTAPVEVSPGRAIRDNTVPPTN